MFKIPVNQQFRSTKHQFNRIFLQKSKIIKMICSFTNISYKENAKTYDWRKNEVNAHPIKNCDESLPRQD